MLNAASPPASSAASPSVGRVSGGHDCFPVRQSNVKMGRDAYLPNADLTTLQAECQFFRTAAGVKLGIWMQKHRRRKTVRLIGRYRTRESHCYLDLGGLQ